jgi:circadian clock protein KaiC
VRQQEIEQKKREIERKRLMMEAQIAAMQAQFEEEKGDLENTIEQDKLDELQLQKDRAAIGSLRGADETPDKK